MSIPYSVELVFFRLHQGFLAVFEICSIVIDFIDSSAQLLVKVDLGVEIFDCWSLDAPDLIASRQADIVQ